MSDVSGEFCGWWKARGASVRAFYGAACAGGELLEVEQTATCGRRGGWPWNTGGVPSPVAVTQGGSMETALVVEKQ